MRASLALRAKKAAVLVASLLFALLLGESALRIVGCVTNTDLRLFQAELTNPDRLPQALFVPSPLLGTGLRPHAQVLATTSDFSVVYRINSRGLRDREHDYARSQATRVLALGDSHTFGEGVPYGRRFTELAEDALADLEIVNAGIPGLGLDQELLLLRAEGIRYRPDLTVLFLNSAQVVRWSSRVSVPDGRGRSAAGGPAPDAFGPLEPGPQYVPAEQMRAMHEPLPWGLGRSYLLSWLRYQYQLQVLRRRFEEADRELWRRIHEREQAARQQGGSSRSERRALVQRRARTVLEEMAEVGRAHEFRLVVVSIDPHRSAEFLASLAPDITCYDLHPVLVEAAQRRRLTFRIDPHLNGAGHEVVAGKLVEILRAEIPSLAE